MQNKNRFTKIFSLILKNLLVFALLLTVLEITLYNLERKKYIEDAKHSGGFFKAEDTYYGTKTYDFFLDLGFRPTEKYGQKHTILLFGCSFTYGANLKPDETFSHILAKIAKSTVYNKACSGWGAQHMLYQLKQDSFYKEVQNPDYIIYTFIDDHLNRLNFYQYGGFWGNCVNLRYKEQNGEFVEIKPFLKPLWHFFIVKELQQMHERKLNNPLFNTKNVTMFSKMMKESLKLTKQHYPNSKFIFLIYSPCAREDKNLENMYKDLEKAGFIIMRTDDFVKVNLTDAPYHFGEDCHPTAKAWEEIAPALAKKLNL